MTIRRKRKRSWKSSRDSGGITSSSRQRSRLWIAYAAACWALVFGVFHVLWAAGWYIGLDPVATQAAFANPWKLAFDIVVAGMCFVAAPVALALVMPWRRRVPSRVLDSLVWTGTTLLVLRALASLIQATYFIATGRFSLQDMGIWEPWFYVGATLFAANLWRYWRDPSRLPESGGIGAA